MLSADASVSCGAATVNHVRLNQDGDVFACALDCGVRVFNLEPLVELASFGFSQFGSVALCELLHRTNVLAVVGGGAMPRFADNTVLVFDMRSRVFVHELTLSSRVLDVRMRRDRLVVVLRDQVHLFGVKWSECCCRPLVSLTTGSNPAGLCDITRLASATRHLLVFPATKPGALQLYDLSTAVVPSNSGSVAEEVSTAPVYISAHQSPLAALALDQRGTMVATASRVGTLVRVWCTVSRCLLAELRRGADSAVVRCLQFSGGGGGSEGFLCCCSDKATVHVFSVRRPRLNRRSTLARLSMTAGGYLRSQWALATCSVPAAERHKCVCTFATAAGRHWLYALCADGSMHKYAFNTGSCDGGSEAYSGPHGSSSCTRIAYDVYLDVCGAADF